MDGRTGKIYESIMGGMTNAAQEAALVQKVNELFHEMPYTIENGPLCGKMEDLMKGIYKSFKGVPSIRPKIPYIPDLKKEELPAVFSGDFVCAAYGEFHRTVDPEYDDPAEEDNEQLRYMALQVENTDFNIVEGDEFTDEHFKSLVIRLGLAVGDRTNIRKLLDDFCTTVNDTKGFLTMHEARHLMPNGAYETRLAQRILRIFEAIDDPDYFDGKVAHVAAGCRAHAVLDYGCLNLHDPLFFPKVVVAVINGLSRKACTETELEDNEDSQVSKRARTDE